eukprot:6070133-Ditylum_brightwellii.AAC.1
MWHTSYPRPEISLAASATFLNNANKDQPKHQMQSKMICASGAPPSNKLSKVTSSTTSFSTTPPSYADQMPQTMEWAAMIAQATHGASVSHTMSETPSPLTQKNSLMLSSKQSLASPMSIQTSMSSA